MPKTRAIVLAGGDGARLGVLTAERAKSAVPFAGKYRIIDFVLSNCVNSHIYDVIVLTQYNPHSLNEHIGQGRPWDLDRAFTGGIQLLQPYKGRYDTDWYKGTADAVFQNLEFVRRGQPDYTLIISGDHIYKSDYSHLIELHEATNADLTICATEMPWIEANRYGIILIDDHYNVLEFYEKPTNPPSTLANMGIYVFRTPVLEYYLHEDAKKSNSAHDFGKDIIPQMLADGRKVVVFPHEDYWMDVRSLFAYWEAHMALLQTPAPIDLHDRGWIIRTRSEEYPPVHIGLGAQVTESIITHGSILAHNALVERSVLASGVYVGEGAVIRDSVILNDTRIEEGAVVERCVIDKIVTIGKYSEVGNRNGKLTSIGKNAKIPANMTIGAGVIIGTDCVPADFDSFQNGEVPDDTRIGYDDDIPS